MLHVAVAPATPPDSGGMLSVGPADLPASSAPGSRAHPARKNKSGPSSNELPLLPFLKVLAAGKRWKQALPAALYN
jgi:hypothetical protein